MRCCQLSRCGRPTGAASWTTGGFGDSHGHHLHVLIVVLPVVLLMAMVVL